MSKFSILRFNIPLMFLIKILLSPFSFLYLFITSFRNHLYNIGYTRSFKFDTKVIAVGNLTVGGTGKTPHIEYLIRLLKDSYKIATLSRGYGRKTKGILIADAKANANSLGDEPMQFYKKFSPDVIVAVGEERALAIPTILFEKPDTQVILLDDAYQHRKVTPDVNILLTDYNRPFYRDSILPGGRLRESRNGAKRANTIIVSKCPDNLTEQEKEEITRQIKKYSNTVPIFFTGIIYKEPFPVFDKKVDSIKKVILFSGIAKAGGLKAEVESNYELLKFFEYSDHHDYSASDLKKMADYYSSEKQEGLVVLTTEKDMVKIISHPDKSIIENLPLYYLPIEIFFLKDKEKFDNLILNSLNNHS